MLYDNAQLAIVYLEAWQHTGDAAYERVAREILDYVAREMTSAEGGFYSATDADSPDASGREEEGRFFTWTADELTDLLGAGDEAVVSSTYGVIEGGNFEGRSILHRIKPDRAVAAELHMTTTRVAEVLANARRILYDARALRRPPMRDEKIITAWNGLMISAFAQAGWMLDEARYIALATRAARFVLEEMRADDGSLLRTYPAQKKGASSFLDDYAFMVEACLDLYQASGDLVWLKRAAALQSDQDLRYLDPGAGSYFLTPGDGEQLLVREKPTYDGAIPSGNSITANNLLRLHDLTGDAKWRDRAERLFVSLGALVARSPAAFPSLLVALDHYYDAPLEIAVIAPVRRQEADRLVERLHRAFVPNKAATVLTDAEAENQLAEIPWLEGKRAIHGRSTAYVCERGRCDLPTPNPGTFQKQIERRRLYPSFTETSPPRLSFERTK